MNVNQIGKYSLCSHGLTALALAFVGRCFFAQGLRQSCVRCDQIHADTG